MTYTPPADLPPRPDTIADISPAIQKLVDGVTDPAVTMGIETEGYGKCVEAMARSAHLAMETVAHELGVTGFQFSMATMYTMRLLGRIDGPFAVQRLETYLYPQYGGIPPVFAEEADCVQWLADEARKRLAETEEHPFTADSLIDHWRTLAAAAPAKDGQS